MGLILILIAAILVVGCCIFYLKDAVYALISMLFTIIYVIVILCVSFQEVGNTKYFIREYEIVVDLIDGGADNAYISKSIVDINKAILYERHLLDSNWTNWLGSKEVAKLKLLKYNHDCSRTHK